MTISITQYRKAYAGNGSTALFPVPFRFETADELTVRLFSAAGSANLQIFQTDYTIEGAGADSGGDLTMLTAPLAGQTILIERRTADVQNLDLAAGGLLSAESLEAALDRQVLTAQEGRGETVRAIRLHPLDPDTDLTLPRQSERADRVLFFDENGQPGEGPDASDIANAQDYAAQALTAKVAAELAQTLAEAAYDAFDDRWLGNKAGPADPATDNDGDPLVVGAVYYNIALGVVRVFNGSAWEDAAPGTAGFYTKPEIDALVAARALTAHTHVIAGVTGLQTALDAKLDDSQVGTGANQIVALNGDGELPEISGANLTDLAGGGSVRIRRFTSGTTYTPDAAVTEFWALVIGAYSNWIAHPTYGGIAGPGYSEKRYSSPTGSYSYGIGAAGISAGASGTTTFDVMTVTGATGTTGNSGGTSPGVGSGGDHNASGGHGGNSYSTLKRGGNGAAGSRAGDGGAGANANSSNVGGGGGTGGDASGHDGGPAATVKAAAAYDFSALLKYGIEYFAAGETSVNTYGGKGASGGLNFDTEYPYNRLMPREELLYQASYGAIPNAGADGVIFIIENRSD